MRVFGDRSDLSETQRGNNVGGSAKLRVYLSRSFMAEKTASIGSKAPHAASAKIEQKDGIYEAQYLGSGTFKIVKPKRKDAKRRQSRLKGTTRGARK